MAQTQNTHHTTTGWVGWSYFAGLMLMLAGIFQSIAGLVAIFKNGQLEPKGDNQKNASGTPPQVQL